MVKQNRDEIKKEIDEFFKGIKNRSPEQVRKIRKKAMSVNIKLGVLRKFFCQNCNHVYTSKDSIRINKGLKIILCSSCKERNRIKINSS